MLDPREGEDEVVKEERFHDGTVLFATSTTPHPVQRDPADRLPVRQRAGGQGRLSKIVVTRHALLHPAGGRHAGCLKDLGYPHRGPACPSFSDVNEPPERDEDGQ